MLFLSNLKRAKNCLHIRFKKQNLFWKICIHIFIIFLVWVSCLLSDICLVFLEISCNQINNCSPFAECLYNLSVDSYRCRCRPGYDGDGISCIPSGKFAVLFIIKNVRE